MKKFSKCSMKKFDGFTDNKYDIRIKWITKKVKHLLRLKSRNPHPSCMIYEGVWSYHKSYIGETVRNVEIRWQEHEDTQKYSEPAKILKNNPTHSFTWKVLLPASLIKSMRQNMKTSIVALKRPSLNPFMTEAVIIETSPLICHYFKVPLMVWFHKNFGIIFHKKLMLIFYFQDEIKFSHIT